MNKEEFDKGNVFGLGEPNEAFAEYFSGQSYINMLAKTDNGIVFMKLCQERQLILNIGILIIHNAFTLLVDQVLLKQLILK